jgi:hypothetical protein
MTVGAVQVPEVVDGAFAIDTRLAGAPKASPASTFVEFVSDPYLVEISTFGFPGSPSFDDLKGIARKAKARLAAA